MSDTPARENTAPSYHDKVYRSGSGVVSGALLLALLLWLSIDAMVNGSGTAPALAASVLVLGAPLIAAFTLWPQVRAGRERLVVRNPFRTIELPWDAVESLVATLSVELRAGGRKFIIWALPVSLRQRKRVGRRAAMDAGDRGMVSGNPRPGLFGAARAAQPVGDALADRAVREMNEQAERFRERQGAVAAGEAEVKVTWTWWLIGPMVAGALATIIILAVG